jgi:hypothetical protein
MRELPELAEAKAAWLNQPDEEAPVDVEHIHGRRAWELFSTTRSEILSSIGAALFFASVMAWRFRPERNRLVQFGCIGVVVWATVTLLRFRNSIRPNTPRPDALARTGVEHYRAELLRRRDHLRSAWIWHGPLLLACTLSAAALANRIVPGRLWDALPVVLLLAVWATFGIKRRLSQAAELQSEIDEISGASSMKDKA